MSIDNPLVNRTDISRDHIMAEVKQIVAEYTMMAPDAIQSNHRLAEDLGCDSLDIVEITMEIEEHFSISIPDELAEQAGTIYEITNGVIQLLAESAPN